MSLRGLVILLAVAASGCTYDVTGPDIAPDAVTPAAPPADAGLSIEGIDVFQQTLEPITFFCSSITVNLDYRDEAARRLRMAWSDAAGANPELVDMRATIAFDALRLLLRCHRENDFIGHCVADARLSGDIELVNAAGVAASRPIHADAADRTEGAFVCGGVADSVRLSVDTTLDQVIAQIVAGAAP